MYGKNAVHLDCDCCSEEDLVDAARGGDDAALERLLMSFPPTQGIIRSLSRRYDPDGHSREELGAAARLGLIEALRRFEPAREVKFTTYAYIFVRSEVLRSLYSQSQRREWRAGRPRIAVVPLQAMSVDGDESEDVIEGELASRDESFGVETGYAAAEKRPSEEAVRHFVAELPENQRKIVHDVFWDEMSHTEAAECRGITRPAVSRTLHRVFKRGRRELGEHVEVLAA